MCIGKVLNILWYNVSRAFYICHELMFSKESLLLTHPQNVQNTQKQGILCVQEICGVDS